MDEDVNGKPCDDSKLSKESIRAIAESVGITSVLAESCDYISCDVKYRLKLILKECEKFSRHGGREIVSQMDFTNALILRNMPVS